MKKLFITAAVLCILSISAVAQTNLWGFDYSINVPQNSDYLDKTSWVGFKIEYRHFFKKNFSAGISVDWATYEQHIPRQTFVSADGNKAVTSDFVAQAYQLPLTATAHYYFKETKILKPYAGIALGAQYLEQSLYYNVYVSEDNNWGFVARPEIGVLIKPNGFENWGIHLGANYSFATNKNEALNTDSFKSFGFTIGVVLTD